MYTKIEMVILINAIYMVTHTCNPSYSGDRDQENRGSKPAQANSSRDPMLKKPITKRACRVVQV
jgi:hypothetical protein